MSRVRCGAALLAALVAAVACTLPVPARAAEPSPCTEAIQAAERLSGVPPALLHTIGVVESGRLDPVSGRVAPWPWTINVEGTGQYFATRADAIAAVEAARAAGRRSIDVGCMQINLVHHAHAFPSLDIAFDPQANAAYAAGFLMRLHAQTRDWGDAAAAYHSQTPGMADDYRRRVVAGWSGAARYNVVQRAGTAGRRTELVRAEPLGGYTPEFRLRLMQDAADRRALRTAMGIAVPSRGRAALAAARLPRQPGRAL